MTDSVLHMELLPVLVTLVGGLGIGGLAGTFVTSRAAARKDAWDNLRWLSDKINSDKPNEARLAFNQMASLAKHRGLTEQQRDLARIAVRDYLRRTS